MDHYGEMEFNSNRWEEEMCLAEKVVTEAVTSHTYGLIVKKCSGCSIAFINKPRNIEWNEAKASTSFDNNSHSERNAQFSNDENNGSDIQKRKKEAEVYSKSGVKQKKKKQKPNKAESQKRKRSFVNDGYCIPIKKMKN